jgi:hypothetical protein
MDLITSSIHKTHHPIRATYQIPVRVAEDRFSCNTAHANRKTGDPYNNPIQTIPVGRMTNFMTMRPMSLVICGL